MPDLGNFKRHAEEYTEEQIYRDAWSIADPGATNPVAVAGTLARASSALLREIGTDGVKRHPALRVMAGQLAMLYNVNSIGAEMDDYRRVERVVDGLNKYMDLNDAKAAIERELREESDA
jgi:hypothetical protein